MIGRMTLPNPPFQEPHQPSFPPVADAPTQAFPVVSPPAKQGGWPGSAKITAIILALTTLGAAAGGVVMSSSAKSDTDDVKKELAAVKADLKDVNGDLKDVKAKLSDAEAAAATASADLESTQKKLTQAETDRDAAQTNLASAQTQLDSLTALFPFGLADMATAPLAGTYQLSFSGSPTCTGYADNAAACSADSLPGVMSIAGDAQNGYSVTLGATVVGKPLLADGLRFRSNGTVEDAVADLCNGEVSTTTYTADVSIIEVALVDGKLQPTTVFVNLSFGAAAAGGCTATNRTVSYTGTL